jgi:hypothetical protein
MGLKDYVLSDQNIYLAIYAAKSYVFDQQLLCREDKELLNDLADPFNEEVIYATITDVKEILKNILEDDEYLFKIQVYYKPKDYDDINNKPVYRPIHTADLRQLVAMVALMHPLIYEVPDKGPSDEENYKLNLSNYSRLIPTNFYGNRVSKRPEELFKKWDEQYKKYTQKADEYLKEYHKSKEFKYELKLDLKNFFPSVDPLAVYGILIDDMPATISDKEDVQVFKNIIYKLMICEVINLSTDLSKEIYYGKSNMNITYTRGIAQGLPQSYFFGNMCMIKISEIFDKEYSGRSVYYVDDSYIYTNKEIKDSKDFKNQLENVNKQIEEMFSDYIRRYKQDDFFKSKKEYLHFGEILFAEKNSPYNIEVHLEDKSTYNPIQDIKDGEVYLRTLSREASQIGIDIKSTYSEEEDEAMLHRTEALLESIESEKNGDLENRDSYKEKLERYYKFFKYRAIKLRLKTEKSLNNRVFEVLAGKGNDCYKALENEIEVKFFFDSYKHDIWQVAMAILISNTVFEHDKIREYINKIINLAYSKDLLDSSYIKKIYEDYMNCLDVRNIPDCYGTLNKQTNRKMIRYANMNTNVLKAEFAGVKLRGIETSNILTSFGICNKKFVDVCKIVNFNSNRLQRMFLNAVYSKLFKVRLSDDLALSSYDKKGINYGELRTLAFLRNSNCDIKEFFNWNMKVMSTDNLQSVDYTIFEVMGAYRRYVVSPDNIDNLIRVHKYTSDIWKNGAKHLYFYTLHNQEHAVDLIKNIIKIVKVFSYLRISSYDYYILFIACYLHDISMVRIASSNDFIFDTGKSEEIVTAIDEKWHECKETSMTKKLIVDTYKAVDEFFEDRIRSRHAKDSAEEIRKRGELNFLEPSVRENVADIAESHMLDTRDIYFLKGDAKRRLISRKFDKILLRFADLLDISERRVSVPILNHNIDNMSPTSAFHWISHLLTEGYTIVPEYIYTNGPLIPNNIVEKVILSVYVNLSQFSKMEPNGCKFGKLNGDTLCREGFELELNEDGIECSSNKCNFLCRWFNEKNNYLVQEMQALEAYLSRVPEAERFYKTKIIIRVVVSNSTVIPAEQFEILKRNILR